MRLPRVRFTVRRLMLVVAAVAVLLSAGRWYRLRQVAQARLARAVDYARLAREADELAWEYAHDRYATHIEMVTALRSSVTVFRDRSQRLRWAASRPDLPLSAFRPNGRNQ